MSMRHPSGFIRPGYNPLEVADAPTGVTPTAGNQSASVDFTPPVDVGGAAVSEYYAVVQPGNITATSVTPPVAVSGLTNGTEYTTKVWANNSYGPSPYSAESAGFTPVNDYVEDVFSTYLYTGNSSTGQNIINGIDLANNGGLVWAKARSNAEVNILTDTANGPNTRLFSNSTNALDNSPGITGFRADGFALQTANAPNSPGYTYASWTFRKAEKFFDVVTYTGTGVAGQTVSHNLGSVPGVIIVKRTDTTSGWYIFHRSLGATKGLQLNTTDASATEFWWNSTAPTDSSFQLNGATNISGGSYVAYIFAHDAGGFGDDGEQNIISCGSYTSTGYPFSVTLGYEPQWVLIKKVAGSASGWYIFDSMRGWSLSSTNQSVRLQPNTSDAEASQLIFYPTATGFEFNDVSDGVNASGNTYIYIAIRRGPMKTPESGTEVFAPLLGGSSEGQGTVKTTGFPVDMQIPKSRGGGQSWVVDRLRGVSTTATDTGPSVLLANDTDAEYVNTFAITRYWNNTGYQISSAIGNDSSIYYNFRRAPGFFDVVAYAGDGTAGRTVNHNLGVAPELMIVKARNDPYFWVVYDATNGPTKQMLLNYPNQSQAYSAGWNNTAPTASVFSTSYDASAVERSTNRSATNYIAYLFATVAGVSKVGSYTGTAANLDVDCGFSAGARFILIKRTDSSGDWYVWDSSRGITAGNDPYLLINSTAAEVTSTDYIDPLSSGFTVTSSAPAALNASGGTYIFLAIA